MSIYNESTLGTANNKITFNKYSTYPIYRVVSRRPQNWQLRDHDQPIPFESGISDFRTLLGQVNYVIEGIMYPGGESGYDSGLAALRRIANLDVSQDDNLSDDGYVPYVFTEYSTTKQIFVKVLYVDLPETTRKGLVQPFRLMCKIKDPTIFGGTSRTATTATADFGATTGTAEYPFEYPVIFGASTSSVSADAINSGDTPIYPLSIIVNGPVNIPKITNGATGEYIEVSCNLATTSNQLIITYDKDSLSVELDGVNQLKNVSSGSTWFKLQPGSNNMTLTGSSISDDAYAEINYYDGYSLG